MSNLAPKNLTPEELAEMGFDRSEVQTVPVVVVTVVIVGFIVAVCIGCAIYYNSFRDAQVERLQLEPVSQDYLDLFDDVDTKLVAAQTHELGDFLWKLHEAGSLRTDFPQRLDLQIGHHVPCHVKALGGEPAGPKLLGLIPGLEVFTIDKSCSGMAGTYGLRAANYADSLMAGRPMLDELKRPRVLFGSTECSACRLQMQEGSRKRALHPIQYLALAYGLLPEVWAKLQKPLQRLATD